MSMNEQAVQNMAMVQEMMAKAQSEKKAEQIQLGNKAHIPVEIDYTADSDNTYKGTITFRRPSAMDYVRMGALKANMFRSLGIYPIIDPVTGIESMAHVDNGTQNLLLGLSTFKTLMVDCPEWFKNYEDLEDADLILHVYNRFDSELLSFRRPAQAGPQGNSENGPSQETMDDTENIR